MERRGPNPAFGLVALTELLGTPKSCVHMFFGTAGLFDWGHGESRKLDILEELIPRNPCMEYRYIILHIPPEPHQVYMQVPSMECLGYGCSFIAGSKHSHIQDKHSRTTWNLRIPQKNATLLKSQPKMKSVLPYQHPLPPEAPDV